MAGFDYKAVDKFKRRAQEHAQGTSSGNLEHCGFRFLEWTRGESAQLFKLPGPGSGHLAFVTEGLGTKALVADLMEELAPQQGRRYFDVARDLAATIFNDLVAVGAYPLAVNPFMASGNSQWFEHADSAEHFLAGFAAACNEVKTCWTGGETQIDNGLVYNDAVLLAGSTFGYIPGAEKPIEPRLKHGDAIVLFESSGIHTNGLTDARDISSSLSNSYLEEVTPGLSYGDALLVPSLIYTPLVLALREAHIDIHYAAHITGHGWSKLARRPEPFLYIIEELSPNPPPIFAFMQKHGHVSDQKAYSKWNMGAGFAVYVDERDVGRIISVAAGHKIHAWCPGFIEQLGNKRKVILRPLGLELDPPDIR